MKGALLAALLAYRAYGKDMGDPNCPCTGDISMIPDGQQNKEIGYGTDCRPWDIAMSYCTDAEQGNGWVEGKEWCGLSWCYVDRDNCREVTLHNGDVVPGNFQQSVIYPTVELYYSYNTCGNLDLFENSGTVWVWDFAQCPNRTANDYYLLVDGSKSVEGDWDKLLDTMLTIMAEGMNVETEGNNIGDRIGMIEFSGKRAFDVDDTLKIFDFSDSEAARISATQSMNNLLGQTWTMMGLQKTIEQWNTETELNDQADRRRILALLTDGRPKPRTTASQAPGDTAEPGCITSMIDTQLPLCNNGESPGATCRNPNCADVDMSTDDCCPGDQNPCTSDQKDALLTSLRDNDILVAVIAVGKDAANMKSDPYDCVPVDCVPGGTVACDCKYDLYYFDCLVKPNYDESADPVPHRITTITNFDSFFQYKDPTASTEGGVDGAICIDPKVLLPPAPPTSACTEIPEPKDVVIILDSSKSMYTTKNRGNTAAQNWFNVMKDLQNVICLYNVNANQDVHKCAFTVRDNVGLVRFATKSKVEYDFNLPDSWWSSVRFTRFESGTEVSNLNRKELAYMTDTVAALWDGYLMMERMDPATIVLQDGEEITKRREIILITDGRPHCKRDKVGLCRPCAVPWRTETLLKESQADAELKIVWRGDRNTHDGTITVDKDQLASDGWFGCLDIDFDDDDHFVLVENFHEDLFRTALIGATVCAQQQS